MGDIPEKELTEVILPEWTEKYDQLLARIKPA